MQKSFTRRRSEDLHGLTEPFLTAGSSQELSTDLCFVLEYHPSSFLGLIGGYGRQDFAADLQKIAQDYGCQQPLFVDIGLDLQHVLQGNVLVLLQDVPIASAALAACKELEQAVNKAYARCTMQPLPYRLSSKKGESFYPFLLAHAASH